MAARSTVLFNAIDNILTTKSESAYKRHIADPGFKDVSSFILVKYMGMSPDPAVREVALARQATLERMSPAVLYRYFMRTVPRQKSGFIRFLR